MNYEEQLQSPNWKTKRKSILERDCFKCTSCLNRNFISDFRISLIGIAIVKGKLVYIIYQENPKLPIRVKTDYGLEDLAKFKSYGSSNQFIALTKGKNIFCNLIATIVVPDKIDYSSAELFRDSKKSEYFRIKSQIQSNYLKSSNFEDLIWIDTKGLHIHHKYYQIGKLAWEYPNEALTTLCWNCHEALHSKSEIDILDKNGTKINKRSVCKRCFGAGRFPEYHYIENGICFRCNGDKFEIK